MLNNKEVKDIISVYVMLSLLFIILNDINCYKDNVHGFFVIEFYINMFIVCEYVLDGECSATCGIGTQKYNVKCFAVPGYSTQTPCVSHRQCKGKYDKYHHDNL